MDGEVSWRARSRIAIVVYAFQVLLVCGGAAYTVATGELAYLAPGWSLLLLAEMFFPASRFEVRDDRIFLSSLLRRDFAQIDRSQSVRLRPDWFGGFITRVDKQGEQGSWSLFRDLATDLQDVVTAHRGLERE